jgi:hypothetical protein
MRVLILALLTASCVLADSLNDIEQACIQGNFGVGKYWLIQCLQEAFTAYPTHLALGTIAPGAGTAALGLTVSKILPLNNAEVILSNEALISTDTSWLAQSQALVSFPALGGGRLLKQSELDAKGSALFRARVYDAKEQWFYGLGPATSLNAQSEYSQKQVELRAGVNNPLSAWSSAGFDVDYLRPRIGMPNNGTPLQSVFSITDVPGLTARDDFVRIDPYITFNIPAHRSLSNSGRVGFAFFEAIGERQFSFRKLSVSDVTNIPIPIPLRPPRLASQRSKLIDFFCPSVRSGAHCSGGDISLTGRLDASYTSFGHEVPFFFDPTLGGEDLEGDDTLRGFGDYRFRAPNRILLQAEYRHPIWAVIGLVVFYDVGKVAFQPSELTLGQLRHDIGLGLDFSVGNHQIARLYVGFGTGEPIQIRPRFGGLL